MFDDRKIVKTFSEEFLREIAGLEDYERIMDELNELASRFEKTYNVVAEVRSNPRRRGTHKYEIVIIPSRRAEGNLIKQGTQNFYHWLDKDV